MGGGIRIYEWDVKVSLFIRGRGYGVWFGFGWDGMRWNVRIGHEHG